MWVRDDRIGLMIEGRVLEEPAIGRRLRRHFAESEPELIGCEDAYLLASRFISRWLQPSQARAAERGECESEP